MKTPKENKEYDTKTITVINSEISKDGKEKCVHFSDGGVIIEPIDFDEVAYINRIRGAQRDV